MPASRMLRAEPGQTRWRRVMPIVGLLALILPGQGDAQTYQSTAPSSITVEVAPDGLVVHQRSVRFEVYDAIPDDIKVGVPFERRLATITTVSDGKGDDQTDTIDVTVDALSDAGLRRITAFSDAGAVGTVSSPYFITTQRGCCSPLTRHHVRNIETGRLLFTATGSGEAGLVALMTVVPNQHPTIERWAAFEGHPEGVNDDRAVLGILRYGDRNGAIDSLALRMDIAKQPEEFILDLPSCGALVWVEPGRASGRGQRQRAAARTCFEPQNLSYSKPISSLGRATVELSLDGKIYATIPVTDDHLDLTHAKLAPGMSLAPIR